MLPPCFLESTVCLAHFFLKDMTCSDKQKRRHLSVSFLYKFVNFVVLRGWSHLKNKNFHYWLYSTVTYSRLAWRIIMVFWFHDWIHWHFFAITVNYNSSHIELLFNDVSDESLWKITASWMSDWSLYYCSNSRMHCLLLTVTRPRQKSQCLNSSSVLLC